MGLPESAFGVNDEHLTPLEVFEPILRHFGPIALDPCSHPDSIVPAHTRILLPRYGQLSGFTSYDGLEFSWDGWGRVFLNPPYGRTEGGLERWTRKASQEGDEVFSLLPVRTSGRAWQRWVFPCDAICWWEGRITHVGSSDPAPFHQAVTYWGPDPARFERAFEHAGRVTRFH